MTESLTIKDLNCSTCAKENTQECPARPYNKFLVQFIGCASHPLALQVLAAPVIAELERVIKSNESERRSLTREGQERVDIVKRCNEKAIKLLKGAP